jgi:hypothetical protein
VFGAFRDLLFAPKEEQAAKKGAFTGELQIIEDFLKANVGGGWLVAAGLALGTSAGADPLAPAAGDGPAAALQAAACQPVGVQLQQHAECGLGRRRLGLEALLLLGRLGVVETCLKANVGAPLRVAERSFAPPMWQ